MTICDPNHVGITKEITVNPDDNTFEYVSTSDKRYAGGAWSGGRFHYLPFCLVNSRPRTPIWDAILLILAGTILILGDDTETISLTDRNGNDLDAMGSRALGELQGSRRLDNFFVQAKGWGADRIADRAVANVHLAQPNMVDLNATVVGLVQKPPRGKGTAPGELYFRREPESRIRPTTAGTTVTGGVAASHLAIGTMLANPRLATVMNEVRAQPTVLRSIQNRSVQHVVNDAATMTKLTPALQHMLKEVAFQTGMADFKHTLRGVRNGDFAYALKRGLTEVRVLTDQQSSELHTVGASDLGSSKSVVSVTASRDKRATVQIAHKLGVKRDELKVRLEGVPVQAGKALAINSRPGLGGLDIVGSAEADASLLVEAKIDGKTIVRRSTLPMSGGVRVKVSQALSDATLNVSRIEQIFGPVRSSQVIRMN
jgi:hypothetical protein